MDDDASQQGQTHQLGVSLKRPLVNITPLTSNPFLPTFGNPIAGTIKGAGQDGPKLSTRAKPIKKKALNPNNETLHALTVIGISKTNKFDNDEYQDPSSFFNVVQKKKTPKMTCCNNSNIPKKPKKKRMKRKKQSIGDILDNVESSDESDSESSHDITPIYYLPTTKSHNITSRQTRQSNGPLKLTQSTPKSHFSRPIPGGLLADEIYNHLSDVSESSDFANPPDSEFPEFYNINTSQLIEDPLPPTSSADNHVYLNPEFSDDLSIAEGCHNEHIYDASYLEDVLTTPVEKSTAPENCVESNSDDQMPSLDDVTVTLCNQELPEWTAPWETDSSPQLSSESSDGFTF